MRMYEISYWTMDIILVIVCLISGVEQTPEFKWPLNEKTFGYEVLHRFDALTPRLDQCFPVNTNGNPNLNHRGTLSFDGSSESVVDVPLDGSVSFPSAFLFSLYAKPTELKTRSVVFHYKAQTMDNNKLNEIILEGNNDVYKTTFYFGGGTSTSAVASSGFVVNTLKLVMSRYSHNTSQMSISFSTGGGFVVNTFQKQLSLPGTLRFGGLQGDPGANFVGELSCATMYNANNIFVTHSEIRSFCNMNYQVPPTVPSCFFAADVQKFIWPMDDVDKGYEVVRGTAPSFYYKEQYNFIEGPANLGNHAIDFDGSYMSTMRTVIPFSVLQNDFELLWFINFHNISDGTILHIDSNNDSVIGIINLNLVIFNGILTLEVFDESSRCAQVIVSSAVIPNQWQAMAIQRSQNLIRLIIYGQNYDTTDSCSTSNGNDNQNMTMSVGASEADKEGFKGCIRCMALYNAIHEINDISTALESACISTEVTSFSPPTGTNNIPLDKYMKFLKTPEACPPSHVPTLFTVVDVSLTSCSKLCINNDHCRTFTYDKSRNCKLYRYFIVSALKYCSETNYYWIKEVW